MKALGFLQCVDIVGATPAPFKGEKTYVSTGALQTDHIDYGQTEEVTYENRPSRANLTAQAGDVLFAKMQSTNKCLLLDENTEKHIFSTGFCAVRAKSEVIENRCLYHLVSGADFLRKKDQHCSGATQKAISNSGLKHIAVTIPPLEDQASIADRLDTVDIAITQCQKILERANEVIESRFIELFGDPLNPTEWELLSDAARLERGKFSPRPRNDPQYYNGNYPFVQTGDIANCDHRLSEYKQTLNEKGIRVSKSFPAGTILIAIVGATIGATAILQSEMYAPDSVIGISVSDRYETIYMEMLLRFWREELLRIAPEAARANINLDILGKVKILKAPIEKQREFVAFMATIDKVKAAVMECKIKAEELKSSLMQEFFA